MNIFEIELSDPFGSEISLALGQLRSPFFEEITEIRHEDGSVLDISNSNWSAYCTRIEDLQRILQAIDQTLTEVDIVVLPEYAFLKRDHGALTQ